MSRRRGRLAIVVLPLALATLLTAIVLPGFIPTLAVPAAAAGGMPGSLRPAVPPSSAATSAPDVPVSAATARARLVLTHQTSWITGPGQDFAVDLKARAPGTSTSDLGITIAVYSCLGTVSALQASLSGTDVGYLLSRTHHPLPWTSLPAAGGAVELRIPVVAGNGTSSTRSGPVESALGGFVADLGTVQPGCGVYPVRIGLVSLSTGDVLGELNTQIVYVTPPPAADKLRFALDIPLGTTLGPTDAEPRAASLEADPLAALDATARALAQPAGVIGDVAAAPAVPVTLGAVPQTVQALGPSGHAKALARLVALAGPSSGGIRQVLVSSYVPVDAAELVSSGLAGQLAAQVQEGRRALATAGLSAPLAATAGGGVWVTNDPMTASTLAVLHSDGYTDIVLPASDVSSPDNRKTSVQPFPLAATRNGSFAAITSDPGLTTLFTADSGDPVLAAHQILAELAQTYFEGPNTAYPRGAVAVPPDGWRGRGPLLTTLLGGLADSPVVTPVTMNSLFAQVPSTTTLRLPAPKLVSATSRSGSLPVAAIRAAQSELSAFDGATPTAAALHEQLGQLLAAAESENLPARDQAALVRQDRRAVAAQLDGLVVAGGQAITLTAQNGRIPITILSSMKYPVTGTLMLSSATLLFSDHTTEISVPSVTLTSSNNVIYENVRARVSGEFRVNVTMTSPTGNLVLTSGTIKVASTAISSVGIVLSLGAIAVLLGWWVRTGTRNRRARRQAARPAHDTSDRAPIGVLPTERR